MTTPSASPQTPTAAEAEVVELRRYTLRPRQRDVLIALFERELIEPQEQAGMLVIGQFVDVDEPRVFVWLRGFTDMRARRESLSAFYEGPVWAQNRDAANATMVASDDVLLLRPARREAAFDLGRDRPPVGAHPRRRGAVAATVVSLPAESAEAPALEAFESAIAPAIAVAGGTVLGYFVTEPSRNDFPRLPVREGEHVLVWFVGFADLPALDAAAEPLREEAAAAFRGLDSIRRIDHLRLVPTARSLLTGRPSP